jgi:hypothetical protein
MTLMCPSRLLSEPYETVALQGKKLRISENAVDVDIHESLVI